MASQYEVMLGMQAALQSDSFTVYTQKEFEVLNVEIQDLPVEQFPVIFIGCGKENNDLESPLQTLVESGVINLNVALNTGKAKLEEDSATVLRLIKNTIGKNRESQIWCDWKYTDSFTAVLRNANDDSLVYGGRNINTTAEYREEEVKI